MTDPSEPQPEQQPAEQLAVVPYANDWRWNNQTSLPPISGQVRTPTGLWTSATHVYISNTTDGGQDVGSMLLQVSVGSTLDLNHRTDPTRTVRYTVSGAPVGQATYVDIPVLYVQSAGVIPTSSTVITVTMSLVSVAGQTCTWRMYPAREPYRFYLECNCQHGRILETIATTLGPPNPSVTYVETTALNLRRKYGCSCSTLAPA